jgi:ABC-type nitrate/sulfonate/bicarbonate transport system permease component
MSRALDEQAPVGRTAVARRARQVRRRSGRLGRAGRRLSNILAPTVILAALLVVWQVWVDRADVKPTLLPSPTRVVEQGWEVRDVLFKHALTTWHETLVGFCASLAVAWVLAVAIDFSDWLRRALMPLLVASQTIPMIAIAPLVVIWFGYGLFPKVVVIAIATFFPVAVGLIDGFNSTDREATNLLRSMGASRWKQFCYVRLPSALPTFFTALRIGITYAMTAAVFAEYVGAKQGLGIYMALMKNSFRTDLVLAAVAITAASSIALFLLTFAVERAVIPWYHKEKKGRRTS